MKVSTRIRYGFRAVIQIAEGNLLEDRLVRIKEISEVQHVSVQYLEQILFELKNKDIIRGKRGPNGGYEITRSPGEITALELFEAIDGKINVVECSNCTAKCDGLKCRTNSLWPKLDLAIKEGLAKITLIELMSNDDMV